MFFLYGQRKNQRNPPCNLGPPASDFRRAAFLAAAGKNSSAFMWPTNSELQAKGEQGGKKEATQAYAYVCRGADDEANAVIRMNAIRYQTFNAFSPLQPPRSAALQWGNTPNILNSKPFGELSLINVHYGLDAKSPLFPLCQRGGINVPLYPKGD
jgi:hypothetical protein